MYLTAKIKHLYSFSSVSKVTFVSEACYKAPEHDKQCECLQKI